MLVPSKIALDYVNNLRLATAPNASPSTVRYFLSQALETLNAMTHLEQKEAQSLYKTQLVADVIGAFARSAFPVTD